MELNHEFTVQRPIDEAWAILTDVELIAPCLPGAQLEEVEGDVYRGVVKVKVGPILAQFKGQASFLERDAERHRAVLKGEGRDTGGKGNASALITAQLEEVSDGVTSCTVLTDLSITGKVAQFGRGALADVSDKLLAQFSDNLNQLLSQQADTPAPEAAAESTSAAEPTAPTVSANGQQPAGEAPSVRKIEGPASEPIDLLETAGAPMLKRLLPLAAVLLVAVLLLRRRRRH
jgi:carbon monoxide dehydrogenase subunit G